MMSFSFSPESGFYCRVCNSIMFCLVGVIRKATSSQVQTAVSQTFLISLFLPWLYFHQLLFVIPYLLLWFSLSALTFINCNMHPHCTGFGRQVFSDFAQQMRELSKQRNHQASFEH